MTIALKDYAGVRFNRLVGISMVERDYSGENNHSWLFRCDCGKEKIVRIKYVRSGKTKSCGCFFAEMMADRNRTHGLSRANPREYRSWKDARARCRNESNSDYTDYGGRGIEFAAIWDDFGQFFADMGKRPTDGTLDRIDVNGNYEPGNCRWATSTVQANNKRSNHRITIGGETKTLMEWCRIHGVEPSKVRYRLRVGMPVEQAFSSGDLRKDGIDT